MNIISSTANSKPFVLPAETRFEANGRVVPLTLRPMHNARGLRLSVDAAHARVLLTMPHCASRAKALAWVETRRGWIEELLANAPAGRPFSPGAVLPVDDEPLTIRRHDGTRAVRRSADALLCGGPSDRISARVEAWLRAEARTLLSADTAHFAGRAGVTISRVTIGDPRRRWGSCSASGAIAYSWRLVLGPRFVRRSVAAHEIAHRLHMDHGPAFHAAHARILGESPEPARDWLRRHGAELHLFGR